MRVLHPVGGEFLLIFGRNDHGPDGPLVLGWVLSGRARSGAIPRRREGWSRRPHGGFLRLGRGEFPTPLHWDWRWVGRWPDAQAGGVGLQIFGDRQRATGRHDCFLLGDWGRLAGLDLKLFGKHSRQ